MTFASIMHSANGHNFIRSGGLEALVNAIKSDNIGKNVGWNQKCEKSVMSREHLW